MAYALGMDGESLIAYDKQLENNFQGMATKSKTQQPVDKNPEPELKKVSTAFSVEIKVPGASGASKSGKGSKK